MTKIAFAKEWRDDALCFIFKGASRGLVCKTFDSMKCVCNSHVTAEPVYGMKNGKCHWNIVAVVTAPDKQALREDELTVMVVHFLRKMNREATYIDDLSKFFNS